MAFFDARGIRTIPVAPRGKRPLYAGWQRGDPGAWDRAPPDANLGILCGSASGALVVLDFDTRGGLRDASGLRPEELAVHTLVARTARGWHVYARDAAIRTSTPWKGLDVRAEGSMVVAPPSIHVTGVQYTFLRAEAAIAPLSSLPFALTSDPVDVGSHDPVDWEAVESLIGAQAAKLRAHWELLKAPVGAFDRSRADFAVARCLWEAGYAPERVSDILCALPGSKASERGPEYALRTARKAAAPRK